MARHPTRFPSSSIGGQFPATRQDGEHSSPDPAVLFQDTEDFGESIGAAVDKEGDLYSSLRPEHTVNVLLTPQTPIGTYTYYTVSLVNTGVQ